MADTSDYGDYLDCVTNLTFISEIKINEKLSIPSKGKPSIVKDTILMGIVRWFFGGSRAETSLYLDTVFSKTIVVARALKDAGDVNRLAIIKDAAKDAKKGIDNLCRTYANDIHFSGQLRVAYDNFILCLRDDSYIGE